MMKARIVTPWLTMMKFLYPGTRLPLDDLYRE
jgi:hypothetical protein